MPSAVSKAASRLSFAKWTRATASHGQMGSNGVHLGKVTRSQTCSNLRKFHFPGFLEDISLARQRRGAGLSRNTRAGRALASQHFMIAYSFSNDKGFDLLHKFGLPLAAPLTSLAED